MVGLRDWTVVGCAVVGLLLDIPAYARGGDPLLRTRYVNSIPVRRRWVLAVFPAAAGEYLHFWMTGIGPVTGRMETGIPASITGDPLQTTTTPFTCHFIDRGGIRLPAPIYFSGLAPGFVGLYQVDLQIPTGLSVSPATLWCDFPNNKSAFAKVPVRLAQ